MSKYLLDCEHVCKIKYQIFLKIIKYIVFWYFLGPSFHFNRNLINFCQWGCIAQFLSREQREEPCPSPSHLKERNILMVCLSIESGGVRATAFFPDQLQPEASWVVSILPHWKANQTQTHRKPTLERKWHRKEWAVLVPSWAQYLTSVSLSNQRHNAGEILLGLHECSTIKEKCESKKMGLNTFSQEVNALPQLIVPSAENQKLKKVRPSHASGILSQADQWKLCSQRDMVQAKTPWLKTA